MGEQQVACGAFTLKDTSYVFPVGHWNVIAGLINAMVIWSKLDDTWEVRPL